LNFGCSRPFGKTIDNNEEMAKSIPTIREDFILIKRMLDLLRNGTFGKGRYTVHNRNVEYSTDENRIELSDGEKYYNFAESLEMFPQEEIDAIRYLFFSTELRRNALSIQFRDEGIFSSCAIFAEDGRYLLGVHYFENNDALNYLPSNKDYAEELEDNYWILFWFMETA
jgi:hypothetical protein